MVTSCLWLLKVFKLVSEFRRSPSDEPTGAVLPAILELNAEGLHFDLLIVAILVYSRIRATLLAELVLSGLQSLEETCDHDICEHIKRDHIDVV